MILKVTEQNGITIVEFVNVTRSENGTQTFVK